MSGAPTPLIEFDFVPVEALSDFSSAHWFGLTDARFCVRAGDQALFEASNTAPGVDGRVEYQLARLHSDLMAMLPAALEPLPDVLAARVGTLDDQLAWLRRLGARYDAMPDEDEDAADAWWLATGWLEDGRRLATGWLRDMPAIWLLRIDDAVHLRWHTSDASAPRLWSATSGDHAVPVDRFIVELRDFHTRLIEGVAARIEALERRTTIDRDAFERDHEQASALFSPTLAPHPDPTDWAGVSEAIRFFED